MESLVHYTNPSHALSVLGILNEQRMRGQMCDTVLVVGDQRYQAHRSVLASSSEYFQSLFKQVDAEALRVVHLDFCEPDAFEIVLNYIYSSSLLVDKGSLAAIQELGYSLGIPFLTNIVLTRPHASYCVSRKRLSFSEEDENDSQARSVIVCRVQSDTPLPIHANFERKESEGSLPFSTGELAQSTLEPYSQDSVRDSESIIRKSAEASKESKQKPTYPYSSILKGGSLHGTSMRPQLQSSVSFSDAETPHMRLQSGTDLAAKDDEEEEEEESLYQAKVPFQGKRCVPTQTIDRSGPLIKSLLRRSLSMDSPVPVFSPTLELKELQNREQSVVKMVSKTSEVPERNGSSKTASPLVLRSKHPSKYEEDEAQVDGEVRVKAEPSSPLADPLEIIRITVGDALPVSLKDFQTNYDQGPRADFTSFGKRKGRSDNRRYPFKKNRGFKDHLPLGDGLPETVPQNTGTDGDSNAGGESRQIFKCWNCLKVFRSSAGLHRHVNMYHNPEKPYACDICHKRFHTNFKVWTHCQTQHGIVQNPASSSSSVLDEKFQKKLIDIVREREIKKALLWKLKRNKQGLQPPSLTKKRSRASFICPYCGKGFLFQSQYKQHLRTHPAEKADQDEERESAFLQEEDEIVRQADSEPDSYCCRLCNLKLSSFIEQGDHERGCRHATVCPYCGLRFSSAMVKKNHEAHCKYKKLTCLECMRTFKSSFSIWRHQVEVHNHNMMTVKDQMNLKQQEAREEVSDILQQGHYNDKPVTTGNSRENVLYSDSSGPPMYDSEDSSSYVPEDLSLSTQGKLVVKEEPMEEAVSERESVESTKGGFEEAGVWPCEKCGNLFSSHKDLERHQELLCHIKPFICHICNKAFRTNFRLWSHFQSHMPTAEEAGVKEVDRRPSSPSPSPPLALQRPSPQASVTKPAQMVQVAAPAPPPAPPAPPAGDKPDSPEPCGSSVTKTKAPDTDGPQHSSHSPLTKSNSVDNPAATQESDTLFYHAPTLSALTFKRQYMCKLCHRTFKTAFSLWSHEQSHGHL